MVCKNIIECSEVYLKQDKYGSYFNVSFTARNRSMFGMNQSETSVTYELTENKNIINFEVLNNDSVDSLVYNTNNSSVCLAKNPALG